MITKIGAKINNEIRKVEIQTDLSIKLSQIFNTDIVSYDSRQFYKQMKSYTEERPGTLSVRPIEAKLVRSTNFFETMDP